MKPLSIDYTEVFSWTGKQMVSDAPCLVRTAEGGLLCSIQLWSWDSTAADLYGRDRCIMFLSRDDGITWAAGARLPFSTGKFLVNDDDLLFFVGSGVDWEGFWVSASRDWGSTWSKPVCLFDGKVYACSTGWVVNGNRVYWAVDDMTPGLERKVFVLRADTSGDLCDPSSWIRSDGIVHPGIPHVVGGGEHNGGVWLEPNTVLSPHGLRVLVRIRTSVMTKSQKQLLPDFGAVCSLEDKGDLLRLEFLDYRSIPGAQNHFHTIHDPVTGLYWMTCNRVTGLADECWHGWANERRLLMLYYSKDGLNWLSAGCLAMWSEDTRAFNYCSPLIDGDDLLVVSRTAENSPNQHDNDKVTFHRVRDFRHNILDSLSI